MYMYFVWFSGYRSCLHYINCRSYRSCNILVTMVPSLFGKRAENPHTLYRVSSLFPWTSFKLVLIFLSIFIHLHSSTFLYLVCACMYLIRSRRGFRLQEFLHFKVLNFHVYQSFFLKEVGA